MKTLNLIAQVALQAVAIIITSIAIIGILGAIYHFIFTGA